VSFCAERLLAKRRGISTAVGMKLSGWARENSDARFAKGREHARTIRAAK
jgi:hypothetical protein